MTEAMEVDAKPTESSKQEDSPKKSAEDLNQIAFENIRELCAHLDRDSQFIGRIVQVLGKTRKQLNGEVLTKLCSTYLSSVGAQKDLLISWIPSMPSSENTIEIDVKQTKAQGSRTPTKPEIEIYIHLLVLLFLVDQKDSNANAVLCAKSLIERVDQHDKRTLDPFLAKAFFYLTLLAERMKTTSELPKYFNGRLRLATLRHQYNTQAMLIVCILRAYLIVKNYTSAASFVSKVSFPEVAHNNDVARFFYYQGRIKALQLEYDSAAQFFQHSLRKAPQDSAIGFKQDVQKWIVVVNLLQGEIPERAVFRSPIHRLTLAPYLKITQAVRLGNIIEFNKAIEECSETFKKDETLTLILRLRQNVIKTAIRQISLTYSRIYISEIAKKLQFPSEIEAEYVVEKAIKDNTIDATIVYDAKTSKRFIESMEAQNVYRTIEPQNCFDTRVRSCLELHNVAVKALRYPSDTKNGDVESIEKQRERELMEMEFASEMADEEDDF